MTVVFIYEDTGLMLVYDTDAPISGNERYWVTFNQETETYERARRRAIVGEHPLSRYERDWMSNRNRDLARMIEDGELT